jgi:aminoglycoside phosphotransferase (APT) family kinase protein
MQPSNGQLLKQLRKATAQLLKESGNAEHKALLGTMDVVLNELLLRDDPAFFIDYYRRGYELLKQGLALLDTRGDALQTGCNSLPDQLDGNLSLDAISAQAVTLTGLIEQLVNLIGHSADAAQNSLLKRITDWELSLYAHRLKRAAANQGGSANQSAAITRENLQEYLRRKKPEWKNLEITHFHQVAGGFSKITLLLDTVDAVNGKQSLAVRAEQPIHMMDLDGSNIKNEYPVVRKAFECGIPVAEPLWFETDSSLLNTRFLVSRKASGTNFGTAVGGAGRLSPAVLKDLARVMANIHNIPLKRDDAWINASHFGKWLDHGSIRQNTLGRIAEWRKQCRDANIFPSPVIARTMNWLTANVPDCDEAPVFLHGDFGPHNILLDGDRVSAALDWEVSTPGDPAYDVSWFLNCTGAAADRQQFLDAYRDAGGKSISEYRLRYFDVFPCMFMPATCNAALRLVEDIDAANINLALYGLQFMHTMPSHLDAAIARAEAVKHLQ